jgi:adenine-specific DNA-methyltransferase
MAYQIESRRYTGSKAKLGGWILDLISKECQGKTFADIFAGTGIISYLASKSFQELIVNDFLYSNNLIYNGFFGEGNWSRNKLNKFVQRYNKLSARKIKDNFFSENFSGKYFGREDSRKIGYIREDIEKNKSKLTKKEYSILIASLIYSTDRIANTVGHYDAYIRKEPKDNIFIFDMIEPINTDKKFKIFLDDTNKLVKKIKADVVYIDPPYNSRQYSRFYHILETLAKWDKPKLYGTALKPEPKEESTSEYCKTNAPNVFQDLIKNLDCRYIVVSYNNTYESKSHSSKNKITLKEIEMTLKSRGRTKIYKKSYRAFTCGKTNFNNHQELVFITKVR